MIKPDNRGIGMNQSVPIDSLTEALSTLLRNGEISRDQILEILAHTPRGENRTSKMLEKSNKILRGNAKETDALQKLYANNNSNISTSDLKVLSIALSAIAYPAFYHLLVAIAEQLRVQESINRAFMNQKMADIYGGYRATALGVDAMIPMLIEAGFIARKKLGVYIMSNSSRVISENALEYWLRTDMLLSGNKTLMIDEIAHRPWNDYCPEIDRALKKPKILKQDVIGGSQGFVRL